VEQRVRQAYDDLARPARFAVALAAVPAAVAATKRRSGALALGALAATAVCEVGRRRAGGARVFPWTSTLCAPAWWIERSVCSWVSLAIRATGGVPYAGSRLRTAAHSQRELDRRIGRG
jgi:hypothetical protein